MKDHQSKSKSTAPSTPGPNADAGPGFEDALAQVEEIIERIEAGEVGLEQAIAEYERGMKLVARCRGVLAQAEQRVEELTRQMKEASPRDQTRSGGSDDDGEEELPI